MAESFQRDVRRMFESLAFYNSCLPRYQIHSVDCKQRCKLTRHRYASRSAEAIGLAARMLKPAQLEWSYPQCHAVFPVYVTELSAEFVHRTFVFFIILGVGFGSVSFDRS